MRTPLGWRIADHECACVVWPRPAATVTGVSGRVRRHAKASFIKRFSPAVKHQIMVVYRLLHTSIILYQLTMVASMLYTLVCGLVEKLSLVSRILGYSGFTSAQTQKLCL
ncbi:hypothetical protein LZ32DRAFT_173928 [Colletotrichum eremochloae]|nr:hypothetical protein LZ32DRAFT_173928 [Colletotrichum eremochloae]